MSRHRLRTAAVVVAALLLLPAGAAHAALPLDPVAKGSRTSAQPAATAADEDDAAADEDEDAGVSEDDDSSTWASDDSDWDVEEDADESDADSAADDDSGSSATTIRSGGTSSTGSRPKAAKRLVAPRGLQARLTAFDRVVVSWRPGSSAPMDRWVVTLRAGKTGRLLYLGRLARSATFTALRPGTRYTATVTATASGGRLASATTGIRTRTLKKVVRTAAKERARIDRAVQQSKAQRFI